MKNQDEKLIEWLKAQCPDGYINEEGNVCDGPKRKKWLKIEEDKDFLNFHRRHIYSIPLYAGKPFESWDDDE